MLVIAYAVLVSLLLSISSTTTLCSPSRAMAGSSDDDIGYAITLGCIKARPEHFAIALRETERLR